MIIDRMRDDGGVEFWSAPEGILPYYIHKENSRLLFKKSPFEGEGVVFKKEVIENGEPVRYFAIETDLGKTIANIRVTATRFDAEAPLQDRGDGVMIRRDFRAVHFDERIGTLLQIGIDGDIVTRRESYADGSFRLIRSREDKESGKTKKTVVFSQGNKVDIMNYCNTAFIGGTRLFKNKEGNVRCIASINSRGHIVLPNKTTDTTKTPVIKPQRISGWMSLETYLSKNKEICMVPVRV